MFFLSIKRSLQSLFYKHLTQTSWFQYEQKLLCVCARVCVCAHACTTNLSQVTTFLYLTLQPYTKILTMFVGFSASSFYTFFIQIPINFTLNFLTQVFKHKLQLFYLLRKGLMYLRLVLTLLCSLRVSLNF